MEQGGPIAADRRSHPLAAGDYDNEGSIGTVGDSAATLHPQGNGELLYFDVPILRTIRRPRRTDGGGEGVDSVWSTRPTRQVSTGRSKLAVAAWETGKPVPHERLIRSAIWARHGQPMHFLTLEFKDLQTEATFQEDSMRRSKRWVEYAVTISGILNVLVLLVRLWPPSPYCDALPIYLECDAAVAALLYFLQYMQLKFDNEFFRAFMHETLFLWSMWRTTASLGLNHMLYTRSVGDCIDSDKRIIAESDMEMSMTLLVVELFLVFRLRFIYFLIFVLYLLLGFGTLVLGTLPTRLVIMCASCCFLSYSFEVLQRQDFIMSSMAWRESHRSTLLLHNILPSTVVHQLKELTHRGTLRCEDPTIAESFDCVTVLFADVVSFTTMSAQITPVRLVQLLNHMFQRFDELAQQNEVEKIKTIGDCYMAAAGLPMPNENHAKTMARFGLQMLEVVGMGNLRNPATDLPIQVRVGMHSGPCVAGIIGHKKFAYDIWGDAVNTAARMESHGEPMKLHCSQDSFELVRDDFQCQARERMNVKGKGEMQTYFVVSEKESADIKSFTSDPAASQMGSQELTRLRPLRPPPRDPAAFMGLDCTRWSDGTDDRYVVEPSGDWGSGSPATQESTLPAGRRSFAGCVRSTEAEPTTPSRRSLHLGVPGRVARLVQQFSER